MLGSTHLLAGMFTGLLLWFLPISFFQKVAVLLMCVLGALFPDIDTPTSLIGRWFKFISWFTRHRGFFHSLFALGFFTALLVLVIGWLYAWAFFAGFLSHLILDSLSKEGLVFFGKRMKGTIKVGGFREYLFQIFFLVASVITFLFAVAAFS